MAVAKAQEGGGSPSSKRGRERGWGCACVLVYGIDSRAEGVTWDGARALARMGQARKSQPAGRTSTHHFALPFLFNRGREAVWRSFWRWSTKAGRGGGLWCDARALA